MMKVNLFLIVSLLRFSFLNAQAFLPVSANGQVVHHAHYSLSYSEKHEQAEWVYYELTSDEARNTIYERSDNFREDADIQSGSASLADYKGSGYDRGHLAPAGDMGFSVIAMSESFYLSNMSPQKPSFNRGIWRQLEGLVRVWSIEKSELFIATGPVLEGGLLSIGDSEVSIPNYYYKVVLDFDEETGDYNSIGFLLPNRKGEGELADYVISIDSIEQVTGIDFYSQLSDEIENHIEANYDMDYWNWHSRSVNTNRSATGDSTPCKGLMSSGISCEKRSESQNGFCSHHQKQLEGRVKPEATKLSQSTRCSATVVDGSSCRRMTRSPHGKCWQHGAK